MPDDKSASSGKAAPPSPAQPRDHVGPSASADALTADEKKMLEKSIKHLGCPTDEEQEAAKREILEVMLAYQQTARMSLPMREESKEQLKRLNNVTERYIKGLEATENLFLFSLPGKDDAVRSAQKFLDNACKAFQSAPWNKLAGRPEKIAPRDLLSGCFQIFDTHRPGEAKTTKNGPLMSFVEDVHSLATGKNKNFDRALKKKLPSLIAWSQELMDQRSIGFFDNWRKGYKAGATVRVCIAGTTNLASIFTDDALTIAADNPQTLDIRNVNGIIYGCWKTRIYTDEENFDLDIEGEGELISINKQPLTERKLP